MRIVNSIRESMEALKTSYASSSEEEGDNDIETVPNKKPKLEKNGLQDTIALPPPPPDLLDLPSNSAYKNGDSGNRIRSFPHVEGNYALHVYIPVNISSIAEKQLSPFIKKAAMLTPELYGIDTDLPLCSAYLKSNDGAQVHVPTLAKQYHISLSRTVAVRVHQIDSIVAMLRHKLRSQKRYWIEFGKWEVFINDDQTRSFLAMEVTTGGLSEISKQVHVVDEVFRLHNLPEFYKNPRPHISVAWGLGDITLTLKQTADELNRLKGNVGSTKKNIWSYMFSGIECKIGQQTYSI